MEDRKPSDPDDRRQLQGLCETLVEEVDAAAVLVSRVIGELLIEVAEHVTNRRSLRSGHGYLIKDFPLTLEVIRTREPRAVALSEPAPDPAEARLLRELGYQSLLMLPLESGGECWGLVELYRDDGTSFSSDDVARAHQVLAPLGER